MPIRLTEDQWASAQHESTGPVLVSDPAQSKVFVLVRAEVYERLKPLFEDDPVTEQERLFQLREFGRRSGWDDAEMGGYDEFDPRRNLVGR